jgi:hypothetical protein
MAIMETNQAKMMAKLDAHHESMIAKMDAQIEGTEACVVKLEANPEESDAVAEHQEAPKEEARVQTFGALKEKYGNLHLAVGCRRQLRKRTQDDGGSRKKLAATHRGMIHHAIPARCKGHSCQGQNKDNVVQGT